MPKSSSSVPVARSRFGGVLVAIVKELVPLQGDVLGPQISIDPFSCSQEENRKKKLDQLRTGIGPRDAQKRCRPRWPASAHSLAVAVGRSSNSTLTCCNLADIVSEVSSHLNAMPPFG